MSEKQWVIVGLDPGTTIGYAILDLDGKLLEVNSSKEFNLSLVIEKVIEYGRVIAVGTDKQRVPSLVEDFAIKTGARVVSPNEDMAVELKQELTKGFEFKNSHQEDSIASALLAYKKIIPTIRKIEEFLEKNKKKHLKNRVIELVIKNEGFSMRSALDILEKPSGTNKIIKHVIEQKRLKESDFFKINEFLKAFEEENTLLKIQNSKLKNEINNLKKRTNIKEVKVVQDEKLKNLIRQKESQLNFLYNSIQKKDGLIKMLDDEIKKLSRFLSLTNQDLLLKKLENLGFNELERKKEILNLKEGDVLLIKNPNIASKEVYESIKNKVNIIVCKESPSKKIIDEFDFIYIDSKKLDIEENEYFAMTKKDQFEDAIQKKDILKKVLKEYRSSQT